ncbi:MAG: hypothetical protein OHK0023_27660 [Anaerolineae bacterium]
MKHHQSFGNLLLVLAIIAGVVGIPTSTAFATVDGNASALQFAQAIAADSSLITGASVITRAGAAGANSSFGVIDDTINGMPTKGSTYGVLSSGRAAAILPSGGSLKTEFDAINTTPGRGDTAYDSTILRLDLNVPGGNNCLVFTFRFYSREFPEYVGTPYNDAFIAELNTNNWTTSGSTISAPNNFIQDSGGNLISINSTGQYAMTRTQAAGTNFATAEAGDLNGPYGATPLLQAQTPISSGSQALYLSIFDQGDANLDSSVVIDNLYVKNAAAGSCDPVVQVAPDVVLTKTFTPNTITVGQTSTLTFILTNTQGNPARTGLGFTDTLPGGGDVIYTGTPTTSCPSGTLSIGGGGQSLTFSGGSMNTGQVNCSINVTVQGVNTGAYVNNAPRVTQVSKIDPSQVNATLTVNAPPPAPTLTKVYATSPINIGATSTLTFTITNSSGNPSQTGIAFTDTLAAGLVFTGSPSTNCPGGVVSYTSGNQAVSLTGGTLTAGLASCTITTTVQGNTSGSYANTSAAVTGTSNIDASGVNATLVVNGTWDDTSPALTKEFTPAVINVSQTSTLTFTLTNSSGNPAQSNITFEDTLDVGVLYTGSPTTTCPTAAVSLINAGRTLRFANGSMTAGLASCTITVTVQGNQAGTYPNTPMHLSGINNVDARQLNATLEVEPVPAAGVILGKVTFVRPVIGTAGTAELRLLVVNSTGNPAVANYGFTYNLPAEVTISGTPTANQCGGTVTSGANSVTISGASFSAGVANCTITANVTSTVIGLYTVGAANFASGTNITAGPISATLRVIANSNLTVDVNPSPIQWGQTSILFINLFNAAGNPARASLGFTLNLPANSTIVNIVSPKQCTGDVSLINGDTTVVYSNGVMAAGQPYCTVVLVMTTSTAGDFVFAPANFSRLEGGLLAGTVGATLTVNSPIFGMYPFPTILVSGHGNRPIWSEAAIGNFGAANTTLIMSFVSNSNETNFTVTGLPFAVAQGETPKRFRVNCTPRPGQVFTGTLVIRSNEVGNPTYNINLICRPAAQTIGLYRPSNGLFAYRLTNSGGIADRATFYGNPGELAVTGDWNGDGIETPGMWSPSTGVFRLKDENNDAAPTVATFAFGSNGDIPIAGDWNGDGIETIGVFRPSNGVFYLRNTNSAGAPDIIITFGGSQDRPVAGDWNGDGIDSPGIWRTTNQLFYYTNTGVSGFGDLAGFAWYGLAGDRPLVGDWNADGVTGMGVFRPTPAAYYLRNDPFTGGVSDIDALFGLPDDLPLGGYWEHTIGGPDNRPSNGSAPVFVPRD